MPDWGALNKALNGVIDPETGKGLIDSGKIKSLDVDDAGKTTLVIEVSAAIGPTYEATRKAAEVAAASVTGEAQAILTAESAPTSQPEKKAAPKPESIEKPKPKIPGVKHIIAVASGKGGVGKSTLALNLALLMQEQGLKVGLLDADIYGPSVPRLVGMEGRRPIGDAQNRPIPLNAFGLQVLSIGFMLKDPKTAMIWRGPMIGQALTQLLQGAAWGPSQTDQRPLDVLFIDMPPGTGDIHLTIAQKVALTGGLIVSTPQDLALIDARKGMTFFDKLNVPILGLIENMSTFVCDSCGTSHDIFGKGGVGTEAAEMGVPLLGAVPLTMALRLASDGGEPLPIVSPNDPSLEGLRAIAQKLAPTVMNEL